MCFIKLASFPSALKSPAAQISRRHKTSSFFFQIIKIKKQQKKDHKSRKCREAKTWTISRTDFTTAWFATADTTTETTSRSRSLPAVTDFAAIVSRTWTNCLVPFAGKNSTPAIFSSYEMTEKVKIVRVLISELLNKKISKKNIFFSLTLAGKVNN